MHARRCDNLSRAVLLLTTGLVAALPSSARAHAGQHLGLKISIGDQEVAYEVLISNDFLTYLMSHELRELEEVFEGGRSAVLDPQRLQTAREAFEVFFDLANPVTIDGVQVAPIVKLLEFVPATDEAGAADPALPPDLRMIQSYPMKGRPRQVSLVWSVCPEQADARAGLETQPCLVAELDAYDENRLISFTEEEPEVIWHAPHKPVKQRIMPPVLPAEPDVVSIPVFSLGVLGVWMASLLALRHARARRPARWPVLLWSAVCIGAALLGRNVLRAEVDVPWSKTVQIPAEQELAEVFSTLHRNIYRAFDYKTESDIYDALALSLHGDLLDEVYNEVYQSLIMRDHGGAVARVESVDILDTELVSAGVLPDSGELTFLMRSRWQVHGLVYHWGHTHLRTNEYRAAHTVSRRGNNWRITGVDVLEQRRVVAPGDDEPAGPQSEPQGTGP